MTDALSANSPIEEIRNEVMEDFFNNDRAELYFESVYNNKYDL